MKYLDLKTALKKLPTFSLQDIYLVDPDFRQPTLYDWEKVGKVTKLRNNCYIFSDFEPHDLDYYLLSNEIYQPSYVSLELALNHYGIIPESVSVTTALTTNKTNTFQTPVGVFSYQSIKPELFFGYNLVEHRGYGIALARLEKAILDYLYFHPEITAASDFTSLRWNAAELSNTVDTQLLQIYQAICNSQALSKRVSLLFEYIEDNNA